MKILLLSIFILPFFFLFSQGNLQFNQVVNLNSGSTYTVPTGKVFKIESISFNGNVVAMPLTSSVTFSCSYSGGPYTVQVGQYSGFEYLTIANLTYSVGSHTGTELHNTNCGWGDLNLPFFNTTVSTLPVIPVPIWLQSGKSVNIASGTFQMLISGIEFNIIP